MRITDGQIKALQEELYADLVDILVKKWNYTTEQALDTLYNSETFERIEDPSTGQYYQSSGYVYSYLDDELTKGTFE